MLMLILILILGEEAFDPKNLGECAEVSEERVGDGELLYFRGCKSGSACTIVLRGANEVIFIINIIIYYQNLISLLVFT